MSLSFEEFTKAFRAWEAMDKRLNELFGFNPATNNHYGVIKLYNNVITDKTSDEELLAMREKYLKWKEGVLALLAEMNFSPDAEQLSKLFFVDCMDGVLRFLGKPVNINEDPEVYRARIRDFLMRNGEDNEKNQHV